MGAAYAKGYIKALIEYCIAQNIDPSIIQFEADFAAFQPSEQEAVQDVKTYQFSNFHDDVVNNWLLGSKYGEIRNAESHKTNYDPQKGHTITDFMNDISKLPQGNYKVVDNKIVKE